MPERSVYMKSEFRQLWPLGLLFALLAAAILLWSMERPAAQEEAEAPSVPEEPAVEEELPQLVTAEQLARMSYEDSTLGEMCWALSGESVAELNRVLREYGIDSPEEISQFLAQAAVETCAGRWLTEQGEEAYFQKYGYTTGTRGAGYFHLTFEYGQMAFAVWMMKKYVPELGALEYHNPVNSTKEEIRESYYRALRSAANLGLDVSRYSRIVYDAESGEETGADYIASSFAWESAAYYWQTAGVAEAMHGAEEPTDAASKIVGGSNWQSRREAYAAFYPVLAEQSK